jgi:general L-amino acid transport system substrate-binding protein
MVRAGDTGWMHVVRWTLYALVAAEELGITSDNVDQMKASSTDPEVKRLLGVGDDLGQKMGLPADWAYKIIKQVGNYGEVYERHVGPKTPLGIGRGLNALWREGGLIIAPPFR